MESNSRSFEERTGDIRNALEIEAFMIKEVRK
jgi:hypothetical protein